MPPARLAFGMPWRWGSVQGRGWGWGMGFCLQQSPPPPIPRACCALDQMQKMKSHEALGFAEHTKPTEDKVTCHGLMSPPIPMLKPQPPVQLLFGDGAFAEVVKARGGHEVGGPEGRDPRARSLSTV